MDVVEKFEKEVLECFFESNEIPKSVSSFVIADIKHRLYSLLDLWNNVEDRRAILTLGIEEAVHYEPLDAAIEIKAMVVVAVRNSEFENLVSTPEAALKLGLKAANLPEKSVKELTKRSIEFFDGHNLDEHNYNLKDEHNIYSNLLEEYPMASNALRKLGAWSNKGVSYPKIILEIVGKRELIDFTKLQEKSNSEFENITVVESGMESRFDKELLEHLDSMAQSEHPLFYSDSFKTTTRNIEKLFIIIEYVLDIEGTFLTNNFLLTNGYVAKRKELLKPMHTHKDMLKSLKNINGLTKTHLKYIRYMQSQIIK